MAISATAAIIRRANAILRVHGPERAVRFLESVARHPNTSHRVQPGSGPHGPVDKAAG